VAPPEEGLSKGIVSVPYHEDVTDHFCPSLIPRWLQGNCRENGSEQRQIQNGEMPSFFILFYYSYVRDAIFSPSKESVLFSKSSLNTSYILIGCAL
jgi:hypothetical protein